MTKYVIKTMNYVMADYLSEWPRYIVGKNSVKCFRLIFSLTLDLLVSSLKDSCVNLFQLSGHDCSKLFFRFQIFEKTNHFQQLHTQGEATALTSKPNHLNVEEPKLNFCHWSFKFSDFLRKQDKRKIFLWLTSPVKHDAMEAIRHWITHQKF